MPPAGYLRLPWLNGGHRTSAPKLTLGELTEAQERDLAYLRSLGLRDDTAAWERARIMELADRAFTADVLYMRLRKADPHLTREAFETHVNTPDALFALTEQVAQQDELANPSRLPPTRRDGAEQTAGPASETGASTLTSWLKAASRWLRGRSLRGSA
jgi:hypothetical protein